MKYPTSQTIVNDNDNKCDIKIRFNTLLDTLPIVEDTITQLFYDFIRWGDSLDSKIKH